MPQSLSVKGIVVGSITVLSTTLVLLILMPVVFMDLIKTGKSDVLITAFWPQIYTLGVVLVSGVFGIYIGSVVAAKVNWVNSLGVIIISVLLTYIINQPVSEFAEIYPTWVTILSYVLCATSLFIGHYLSKILITRPVNRTP